MALPSHAESGSPRAKEMVITAKTVTGSTDSRFLRFSGDVVVEDNFTLCSDELFVRYGKAKVIEEVVATGNVRVVQGEKRARGGRGIYNRYEDKVVITESASMVECSNVIKGETITLHTDENVILIEGGTGGRASVVITPDGRCEESVIYEEFQCGRAR
jgi:lipopolysaccharide export system protein LptA